MTRSPAWTLVLGLVFGLLSSAAPAYAVITRLIPLREVLASEQLIFTAKVEKLDRDKPALTLQIRDDLKGKAPFRTLPVPLTPDTQGERAGDTPRLLKRLAPDLTLIVFASQRGKRFTAFAYTEGTWFQMIGQVGDDSAIRWSFTHCEPYLRRTFHGTTAELRQVLVDGLADKKQPPEPDPKEPPGLGPEISSKNCQAPLDQYGPLFAIIPTFVIVGPLALLATLFPAIFGGLALLLRRWAVLLATASLTSMVYLGYCWFHGTLKDHWWGTAAALWGTMALIALAGMAWSGQRRSQSEEPADSGRAEGILVWCVSLLGLAVVIVGIRQGTVFYPPWRDLLVVWSVAWVGAGYWVVLHLVKRGQPAATLPSTERVMLGALTLACAGSAAISGIPTMPADGIRLVWTFEPKENGAILSSGALGEKGLYIASIRGSGFSTGGVVYCLNPESGEELWRFDDGGAMQRVFSSPCLDDGRLYIGEGLHENRGCKFYCLDAASGRKLWDSETASHIESSPCVANGNVYFGAGADGIYCLDAKTAAPRWHFQENLHIDTSPKVVGNRLYAGSGVSRTQHTTEVFCLDADSGRVIWRHAAKLPVWGSPCVAGNRVFFGLGNGRFDQSDEHPAGALLCVDAEDGKEIWCYDMDDAVLMAPAVEGGMVYFGSRDHHAYCLQRDTGQLQWKADLGSPVVARLGVGKNRVYVVASAGLVCCLDSDSGEPAWVFDVAEHAQSKATLLAAPASEWIEHQRRLYIGASLERAFASQAVVYALETSELPTRGLRSP
ncbi:MAG TPA: PQQ-binding-like beta-propeller repeat protein [Gemmataceae bacterium]|nr:PQQ-binding-like beta-propeller repeat protein [Gemmataceae bacterium]